MIEFWLFFFLIIGAFCAGFIDAVVGGGGLIQVPLLFVLFPNMPHTNVIASNRFASIGGTVVAARHYLKTVKVNYKYIFIAGLLTAIASYAGTYLMKSIPLYIFKRILFVLLTLYTFLKKEIGQLEKPLKSTKKLYFLFAAIGFILGLYNGTIGPGTGTLLVFALVQFVGFNFLKASAYAKVINAIADAASLFAFFLQKVVIFKIALPMMGANIIGSYIGTKMAIKNGNKFIRLFFIVVMLFLLAKLGWDICKTF
ncbi:MAG: TSUP family transporter [Ferruginibacter sp.]